jgi:hypothetical protein
MQANWAVVCGLVRDPAAALHQASVLDQFRAEGLIQGVVISTWEGELDAYPEVRAAFDRLDALVVTSREPILKAPGNLLHQSKAILLGLDACPADAMVLKMRFDLAPLGGHLRPVLSGERLAAQEQRAKPTVFSRPVMAHGGLMFWPFFLNDIYYYGARSDLQMLGRYDVQTEVFYNDLGAEQCFHLPPFARKYPSLSLFARLQKGLEGGHAANNRLYTEILLGSDLWYRVWAIYAKALLEDYYVGMTEEAHTLAPHVVEQYARVGLGELLDAGDALPFLRVSPVAGALELHSSGWALAAVEGVFKRDAVLERFQDAYAAISAGDDVRDSAVFPDPAAAALAERIEAAFPEYTHKLSLQPADERERRLTFRSERIMSAQQDTRALELQVAELRRLHQEALVAAAAR